MIAKTILVVAIVVVAAALVRAIVLGRIEFGAGGSDMVANRATQPTSFWTIFTIGVGTIAFMAWLVLGA